MADQMEFSVNGGKSVSDEVLRRQARRIVSTLSQITECLDDREIVDLNEILLELVEVSKQRDGDTRKASTELYMRFFERVEFRSGISLQLIKQAIRALRIVQDDVEYLGKIVYNMYMEMMHRDYPSLVTSMKMNPGLEGEGVCRHCEKKKMLVSSICSSSHNIFLPFNRHSYNNQGSHADLPRSGRPRVSITRDNRFHVQESLHNRRLTVLDLTASWNQTGVIASTSTVHRRVKDDEHCEPPLISPQNF